jgi:hypothetical protein
VNRRGRGPYWVEYIKRISLVQKEEIKQRENKPRFLEYLANFLIGE